MNKDNLLNIFPKRITSPSGEHLEYKVMENGLAVRRISRLTHRIHQRVLLGATEAALKEWCEDPRRPLIQNTALGKLSAIDREFLINGVTPEEWDNLVGKE